MVFEGAMLTGCGSSSATITAVTREEGSGTRGAFVELFGLEDADGNETISQDTQTTNSTAVMITTVQGNENAIGYISLGSLNDDVKAVQILSLIHISLFWMMLFIPSMIPSCRLFRSVHIMKVNLEIWTN